MLARQKTSVVCEATRNSSMPSPTQIMKTMIALLIGSAVNSIQGNSTRRRKPGPQQDQNMIVNTASPGRLPEGV
jgi:hypothetical protein